VQYALLVFEKGTYVRGVVVAVNNKAGGGSIVLRSEVFEARVKDEKRIRIALFFRKSEVVTDK